MFRRVTKPVGARLPCFCTSLTVVPIQCSSALATCSVHPLERCHSGPANGARQRVWRPAQNLGTKSSSEALPQEETGAAFRPHPLRAQHRSKASISLNKRNVCRYQAASGGHAAKTRRPAARPIKWTCKCPSDVPGDPKPVPRRGASGNGLVRSGRYADAETRVCCCQLQPVRTQPNAATLQACTPTHNSSIRYRADPEYWRYAS